MTTKKKKELKRSYYPFNHKDCLEVKDNKAVLIMRYDLPEEIYQKLPFVHDAHLCGYVALPADSVPIELCYLHENSYLHYLNVPGGITFCQPKTDNEEFIKIVQESATRKLSNLNAQKKAGKLDGDYITEHVRIEQQASKDLFDLGAKEVVFGFDTGHAGDDDVQNYQDVKFIMKCCEQMEQQVLELCSRYQELEAATPEQRLEIMDDIRSHGDIATMPSPMMLWAQIDRFRDDKEKK